jgi:hypothetical protein
MTSQKSFFCLNNNINNQKGFILVMLLFFILMIALLVLSLLNSTHIGLRMSQNYSMASQQFQAAEAGLKMAEDRLSDFGESNAHDELNYAGYHVSYDIQRLNLAFCMDQQVVYYYRVTSQAKQAQQRALILQTTYAGKINKVCQGTEEKLKKLGRSAWRQFH